MLERGGGDWSSPEQSALQWKSQVLRHCPRNVFRTWQRYGKVLPSSIAFGNNSAAIIFRVSYLNSSHWIVWWAGWCPVLRLAPCLCCSLCRKLSALGQSSVPVPNVSLCPIRALEIHKINIWGLPGSSHLSGYFISHALGLVLNTLDTCISNRGKRITKWKLKTNLPWQCWKETQINPIINRPLSRHIFYKSVPECYGEQENSTGLKTENNDERQAALRLGHQQYFSTWHKKNKWKFLNWLNHI